MQLFVPAKQKEINPILSTESVAKDFIILLYNEIYVNYIAFGANMQEEKKTLPGFQTEMYIQNLARDFPVPLGVFSQRFTLRASCCEFSRQDVAMTYTSSDQRHCTECQGWI